MEDQIIKSLLAILLSFVSFSSFSSIKEEKILPIALPIQQDEKVVEEEEIEEFQFIVLKIEDIDSILERIEKEKKIQENKPKYYSAQPPLIVEEDVLTLVAKMLFCEAGGTSYECKRYTCSAIVNLIESKGGDYSLLDNANRFQPAPWYRNSNPSQSYYDIAQKVLNGDIRVPHVKYFQTGCYHTFGTPLICIDGVYFSTD